MPFGLDVGGTVKSVSKRDYSVPLDFGNFDLLFSLMSAILF